VNPPLIVRSRARSVTPVWRSPHVIDRLALQWTDTVCDRSALQRASSLIALCVSDAGESPTPTLTQCKEDSLRLTDGWTDHWMFHWKTHRQGLPIRLPETMSQTPPRASDNLSGLRFLCLVSGDQAGIVGDYELALTAHTCDLTGLLKLRFVLVRYHSTKSSVLIVVRHWCVGRVIGDIGREIYIAVKAVISGRFGSFSVVIVASMTCRVTCNLLVLCWGEGQVEGGC
jgi:hypothetical protein